MKNSLSDLNPDVNCQDLQFFDMEQLGMPKDTAGIFHTIVYRLKLHMQMLKCTLCLAKPSYSVGKLLSLQLNGCNLDVYLLL